MRKFLPISLGIQMVLLPSREFDPRENSRKVQTAFHWTRIAITLFFSTALCCQARSQVLSTRDAESNVPEDQCILELDFPDSVTVTVDGRDIGATRRLVYRPLQPGKSYSSTIRITYTNGKEDTRVATFRGGQVVRFTSDQLTERGLTNAPISSAGVPTVDQTSGQPELVLQMGTPQGALCAAVSSSGRYLLTGSTSNTVNLWDLKTGHQLRTYSAHTEMVNAVAFSPDDQYFVSASSDGTVVHWEVSSGRKLRTIHITEFSVTSIAYSSDGRGVLAGTLDRGAALWDIVTGEKLRSIRLRQHFEDIECLALSPDGDRALVGDGKTAVLVDIATGRRIRTIEGLSSEVAAVAFSPDGRRLLIGLNDGTASLWDAETGEQVHSFKGHSFWVKSVAFDGLGKKVLTCSESETIVWDIVTGERLRTAKGNYLKLASSHGYRHVLAVGSDFWGGVVVSDPMRDKQQVLQTFRANIASLQAAAITPDGRRLLTAAATKELAAVSWNLGEGRRESTFPGDLAKSSSRIQIGLGRLLQSVGANWQGHNHFVTAVAVSPNGQRALTGSLDKTAVLWDVSSGKQLRRFRGHSDRIESAAFSPDAQQFATGSYDKTVVLWNVNDGQKIRVFEASGEVSSVVFAPDSRHLLVGTWADEAILWEVATGKKALVLGGHNRPVDSVAVSKDGHRAATTSWDNTTFVWDLSTGKKSRTLRWPGDSVKCPTVFSPDGRTLLVGYGDGSVVQWDVASGKQLRVAQAHSSEVVFLAYIRDAQNFMTASHDGTVRAWESSGEEVIRLVSMDGGKDWLVTTPEGLFDGSAEAREKIMFRVGGGLNVVPVDRFFQDFYYPGLLAAVWRGEQPVPQVEIGQSLPPIVRIIEPQQGGSVDENAVTVVVEATDEGGGIRGPWLVQNDARVHAQVESVRKGQIVRRTFQVDLVQGGNQLEFQAASADGSWESEPAVITFQYEDPLPKSDLFLVSVGINDYEGEKMDMEYAVPDALSMAGLFDDRGRELYANVHIATLIDGQATSSAILETIANAGRQARPQDTVAVFLAGHGTVVRQQYYFVPGDFQRKADSLEDDVQTQALLASQINDVLGSAKALRRMLVFDTGQSGGDFGLTRTARNPFAFRGAVERLARSQGTFAIAAAAISDTAVEVAELKHGVLTYSLLAGLRAVSEGPLSDQWIEPAGGDRVADVLEWFGFASARVPQLTKQYFKQSQDVQHCSAGTSFPVLPVPETADVPNTQVATETIRQPIERPSTITAGHGDSDLYVIAVGVNPSFRTSGFDFLGISGVGQVIGRSVLGLARAG